MGILDKIVGGGIANLANGVAGVIDRFVQTPDEKAAAKVLQQSIAMKPNEWQIEINKIEAKHRTIFVAGWRPAVGWICAAALCWAWVLAPILTYVVALAGSDVVLPKVNTEGSLTLLTSLLGVAALRTVEKAKGIAP